MDGVLRHYSKRIRFAAFENGHVNKDTGDNIKRRELCPVFAKLKQKKFFLIHIFKASIFSQNSVFLLTLMENKSIIINDN